jgi:hypothetical protein
VTINIYLIFSFLYVGEHPFLNLNGTINYKNQVGGEYKKVKEGRYSSTLIDLMERMMDVVCWDILVFGVIEGRIFDRKDDGCGVLGYYLFVWCLVFLSER